MYEITLEYSYVSLFIVLVNSLAKMCILYLYFYGRW